MIHIRQLREDLRGKRGQATLFGGVGGVRGLVKEYVVSGKEGAMITGYFS
jgi:hypothetical protein